MYERRDYFSMRQQRVWNKTMRPESHCVIYSVSLVSVWLNFFQRMTFGKKIHLTLFSKQLCFLGRLTMYCIINFCLSLCKFKCQLFNSSYVFSLSNCTLYILRIWSQFFHFKTENERDYFNVIYCQF